MKKTIYFLLICFTGIMFSCSEDDVTPINNDQLNYQENQISFKNFLELEGQNPKIKEIQKYFQSYSLHGSNKDGDNINWEIDTTRITQIITDALTTYTFGVIEYDSVQGFRNVIIRNQNNNTQAFLVHYPNGVNFESLATSTAILEEIEPDIWQAKQTCYVIQIFTVTCDQEAGICTYGWDIVEAPCTGDNNGGGGPGGGTGDSSGDTDWGDYGPGLPTLPTHNTGGSSGGSNSGSGTSNSAFNNEILVSLTHPQIQWLEGHPEIFLGILVYLDSYGQPNYQNGYYGNSDAVQFVIQLITFLEQENGIKDKLRQAIASGITSTAEYSHKIFKKFSQWTSQYPSSITLINSILSGIKYGISDLVDTNPNTCTFADLFNMWLFELGTNPLNINGLKVTTNQLKNQEGVNQARAKAMIKIQMGNISAPVNHGWIYGQGEFYDGMQNGNFVTAFLGSYTTNITIT